jgi:mannose-1-phosphate guanylyltransferase
MEKADNILVAEADFEWDDVGAWPALKKHLQPDEKGNVAVGKFAQLDTKNCTISTSSEHLIAAVGVENLIIVHTDDATLICREEDAQDIKKLLNLLKDDPEMKDYL